MPDSLSFIRRALVAAALSSILAATALAAPAAGADPSVPIRGGGPPISAITVQPGGREATVYFSTAEPTAVSVTYTPAKAAPPPAGGSTQTNPIGALPIFSGQGQLHQTYEIAHQVTLTGLASDTSYLATVTATTRTNQTYTANQSFTTLKQRVRVTLDSITITDDGDWVGNGEPTWYWELVWNTGSMKDCYPQTAGRCTEGSEDEGTITPHTRSGHRFSYVLAEENFRPVVNPSAGSEDFTSMPQSLRLRTTAKESDSIPNPIDAWEFHAAGETVWQVPQNVDSAEQQVTLKANADGFRSTMTFTFQLFYNNATYTPNDGRVHSTSK